MAVPLEVLPATHFDDLETMVLFPSTMLVRPCHAGDGSYIRVGSGAVRGDAAGKVEGNCEGGEVSLTRASPSCRPLPGTKQLGQAGLMTPELATYPGYGFPTEIISHAVWLYHVFSLSFRDVELLLAERGITVTHESMRQWCLKFGADFARKLRRRRPKPGDTWHFDEVFLKINGELHYLWRAVDQHGVVLDILVQDRRNATAAKRFFKRLLAGLKFKPKRLVTDGLRSYGVAHRDILPQVKHRTSRYLNNRAENSHRPTRRRERQM